MSTVTVSFSLFGSDPENIYHRGAVRQAYLYRHFRPGWNLWFYVGRSVPDSVIADIRSKNDCVSFEFVNEPEDQTATWWRYRAIRHCTDSALLFRDVDSRLCEREDQAVTEWLSQGQYTYHVIRDHQYHNVKLLAGLWGIQRPAYRDLNLTDSIPGDFYQTDQQQLVKQVWPACRRRIMAHIGSYHVYERMPQRRPLIVPRPFGGFVAQGFYGDETPRFPEHAKMVDSDDELLRNPNIFEEEFRRVPGRPDYVSRTNKR